MLGFYWGCIGVIMGLYWFYMGIMVNKMETVVYYGERFIVLNHCPCACLAQMNKITLWQDCRF